MDSPVQKIKERLKIEDVISSYIKLEASGANLRARCPFHNEKTPSFFVSPARGSYYCFGCSARGDIFTFVEEFEGLDFKGALKMLATKAGVTLDYTNIKAETAKDRIFLAMEEAGKFFTKNLPAQTRALKYLQTRGLTEKSITDFKIGFAQDSWQTLFDHLKQKGFTEKEIEIAGLAKRSEKDGKSFYDRFRGRIIFPICDTSGRIIAFTGRILDDDGKSAKYLNSPETPIFSKSAVFFGLDKAKDSIRKNNFSILVEGQMDLILAHQAGFRNTIATSGTALSDQTLSKENIVSNLGLVRRLSQNIVLAFDGDKAGISAIKRAAKIALSLGMDVKVADMGAGMDPADIISKEGTEKWREIIRNSKHIILFVLEKAKKESAGDERKLGRLVLQEVLPYVAFLDSNVEQMHFIKKISDETLIKEQSLQEDLKRVIKNIESEQKEIIEFEHSSREFARLDYIEKKIVGIVFWQKEKDNPEISIEEYLKDINESTNIVFENTLEKYQDKKDDFVFEAEIFYGQNQKFKKDFSELIQNFKEEYFKEELGRKMKELQRAELEKNKELSAKILKECQDLNNKIEIIKQNKFTS